MTTTRTVSSTELVRQDSIQYIRSQTLTLTLVEARPNTKMYVFIGDKDVTDKCNLVGNSIGTSIVTDTVGQASIQLYIPGGTFNTGNQSITISDTQILSNLTTTGSVFGSASAVFESNGILKIFQETDTTITTVTRTVNVKQDPLAQSFFTYGVKGGLFITSIEAYFQTKDDTIPVRCEIRPMVNGYPAPIDANNVSLVSIVNPANVNISSDASLSTKFTFNPPIYLKEDSDYCFVLRSNSNNYNAFTSRMGEKSLEDGVKIFDNPYVGSLFKSENNITWTAEQFEDIKFKINKAVFDTVSASSVEYAVTVPPTGAFGSQFYTTSGSNIIKYTHTQEHGLEVGSKFKILTRTDSLFTNAAYNGIPYTQFNATHTVISVINRNTFTFQVSSNATSTGTLTTTRIVNDILVLGEGINYSSSDTISFSGGGGASAAGTLNVVGGMIKSVTITNSGTGYTSAPSITINTSTGSGASLVASVTPSFTVYVNKPMVGFIPKVNISNIGTTTTTSSMTTTIGNYDGGNLTTYTSGKTIPFQETQPIISIDQNSVIASTYNEVSLMSGNKSAKIHIDLFSDNPNISPIIDTNRHQYIEVYSNKINNQTGETLTATNSSGTVSSITVTNAGSGYTVNPIATISAPDLVGGVQATATVTRSGSSIATIVPGVAGSGYTSTPTITITRGVGDTTGVGGAGQVVLTEFNTELLPTGGLAKSRYITKKTTLQMISSGVRLFSVISSTQGSSIDWYIRTSLSASSVDHDTKSWVRLSCDTERNKSSYVGELFEYMFYLNDISAFDTYDLKAVFSSNNPVNSPIIQSYRVIVVV